MKYMQHLYAHHKKYIRYLHHLYDRLEDVPRLMNTLHHFAEHFEERFPLQKYHNDCDQYDGDGDDVIMI